MTTIRVPAGELRMPANHWSGQTFPHPAGRKPFVGDLRLSLLTEGPLQSMLNRATGLGPIFEAKIMARRVVFVGGPELVAELCEETRFAKAPTPVINALRELGGDGLFTAYNDEPNWQLAHDLLMPAFTKTAMQSYHDTMLGAARDLFDYWDRQDGPIDVARDMTKLTMETISRTAFSRDFGSFNDTGRHPFVPAMIAALRAAMTKGFIPSIPGFGLVTKAIDHRNRHHLAYVESMLDDMIAERRGRAAGIDGRVASSPNGTPDLLDIMLHAAHQRSGDRLDDINIRRQILTFMIAGHETTSGALSFALYYLSLNPEIVATAQSEVDSILGPDRSAEPTYEQVAKFRYIRRILDEGLRLWPTVPGFPRMPREDTVLGGKYRMTTDDFAIIVLSLLHRDPKVWPDPDRFDPDRFLPANVKARPAHSYKPFGVGERACIGRQFALHEAVLVLARMLHRYDIAGDPAYRLRIDERLTIVPKGLTLTLTERQPASVPVG